MTQVKELWKLKLVHEYFMSERCDGGRMVLSRESEMLLMRRQCIMRQVGLGEWELLGFDEVNFNVSDTLEMDCIINDRNFLYYTQWNWNMNGACPRIDIGIDADVNINMADFSGKMVNCKPNVCFQLAVSLQKIIVRE
ncbi:MAG: hypothetical protein LUE99_18965 [Bacteroides sp.]|nr:hypothetical protein [Bacteroides sp.]